MSFSQLYSALEQGVVDGQENPFGNIVASKFNEVQKYLTTTGHIYNANIFLISKKFWDTLTEDEKTIVKKVSAEAMVYQRKLNEQEDQESVADLTKKGMKITELNAGEKERIQQALQPVYKQVGATVGQDTVDKVVAATK